MTEVLPRGLLAFVRREVSRHWKVPGKKEKITPTKGQFEREEILDPPGEPVIRAA